MTYAWIDERQHGKITAAELPELLRDTAITPDEAKYLAFYSNNNGIKAGYWQQGNMIPPLADVGQLLELRLFNDLCELKISRFVPGRDFYYRVASELAKEMDAVGTKWQSDSAPTALYAIEEQWLDISELQHKQPEPQGAVTLFHSTAGGSYELPVPGDREVKKIVLVNYFKYHGETGNLQFLDFRIKGFI